MAVRELLFIGDERLYRIAEKVDFNDPELPQNIQDLTDSNLHYGGSGLAAPQIDINKQIIRFGFEHNPRYPEEKPVPITILINPEFEVLEEEPFIKWEACYCIPHYRGKVARPRKIRYWGFDENKNRIERIVENFHAKVFQHEYDHLQGILYTTHLTNLKDHFWHEKAILPKFS
jgi:peptide deformylase